MSFYRERPLAESSLGMCAANHCRSVATVALYKDGIKLTLCERHAGTYRTLGYTKVPS